MAGGRKLVIVESPGKVKTIQKYLGDDYVVEASIGHIRDLPQPSELPESMKKGPYGRFAVDVDDDFAPHYVVSPDKKKKVTELKKILQDADELYLATDEDREGEAIAWHLLEALKPDVPVKRMAFHEITEEAIQRALQETRDLDSDLVDAQETRRILDRLYGYEVSPVLWRKVRQGTSAGRVQSVATRLVVERERERMAFVEASWWDLSATFTPRDREAPFTAKLASLDGGRLATGKDFADDGTLKNASAVVLDEDAATGLAAALDGQPAEVSSVTSKPYRRSPAAPFTTSSLQQEASRKLGWSTRQTMSTAQRLYEGGYITYMRTDSVALSGQAVGAARSQIAEMYGAEYVPEKPRVYKARSQSAQEAHEAIRPAGDRFRTPAQVASQLVSDQFRLYELIWKRTVASQMNDASGQTSTMRIAVQATDSRTAEFSVSGTVITFRGFLAAYEEGRDTSRYDDGDSDERRLPQLAEGQALTGRDFVPGGHTTTPPPRYTEASLVRALEERGIGRPSTYASTISTIMDRGYVRKRGTALIPLWIAFSVVKLLEQHFSGLIDYDFTAQMEEELDAIAQGRLGRVKYLEDFYFGDPAATERTRPGLKNVVADLGEIDARAVNSVPVAPGVEIRVGRYGPYLERPAETEGGDPIRANVPEDLAPDEMTPELAEELFARKSDDGRVLGQDPATGHDLIVKDGRYGPYFSEVLPEPEPATETGTNAEKPAPKRGAKKPAGPKPRTASLLKSMDMATVTLEDALKLLSLPRVVGTGEDGTEITVQNGRYGPYLKKGSDSRSLGAEEELFTVTEEQARTLFAQPKYGGRRAAKPPLAELGTDPASEKPIIIKDGRFGPYITDGTTNVSLKRDELPGAIDHDMAVERLKEKRAAGPAKKRTTGKSSTGRKSPAKKSTKPTGTSRSSKSS